MTHASTHKAPTTSPGRRPARKTPGGNGLLEVLVCGFVESIPDACIVGVVVTVDVTVDVEEVEAFGVVELADDELAGAVIAFEAMIRQNDDPSAR